MSYLSPYLTLNINLVITNLYIGTADAAESTQLIQIKNIKHIVTILDDEDMFYFNCASGVKNYKFLITDGTGDIIDLAEKVSLIIKTALEKEEAVLVHCAQGISRSASVIIYYLMKEWKWKWKKAYKYL